MLDLGETCLGLFLFSLTTLSRSLTHTHITHILFKCAPGRGQSCVLLRQFGGGGWRSVDLHDLDPVTGVRGNVEHRVGRGSRAATAAAAAAAGSTRGCLALDGGDGGGVRVHDEREELGLGR